MSELWQEFKRFFKQADILLLILCCIASLYGVLLISSATKSYGSGSYVAVQLASIALGIGVFVVLSLIDLEIITRQWKWLILFNIVFLLLLFLFGVEGDTGNRSWIRFSFLPVGI